MLQDIYRSGIQGISAENIVVIKHSFSKVVLI